MRTRRLMRFSEMALGNLMGSQRIRQFCFDRHQTRFVNNAGLADTQLQARLIDLGQTVVARSATAFAQRIAADADKWANVIHTPRVSYLPDRSAIRGPMSAVGHSHR